MSPLGLREMSRAGLDFDEPVGGATDILNAE
jgi:hypothetical protein